MTTTLKRWWPTHAITAVLRTPSQARMLKVEPERMLLDVDGSELSIAFDHTLSDSEDAHRTLVAMLRAMPQPGNAD